MTQPDKAELSATEQKARLRVALKIIQKLAVVSEKKTLPEAAIIEEVFFAMGGNASDEMKTRWLNWLQWAILSSDSKAFKRMAAYIDGWKKAHVLPSKFVLKESLIPKDSCRGRGAPNALKKDQSNFKLFAQAALIPVMMAEKFGGLPSAERIEADLNTLRKQLNSSASPISKSQFSACAQAFGLQGLLTHKQYKHGPIKGTRQGVRNKRK